MKKGIQMYTRCSLMGNDKVDAVCDARHHAKRAVREIDDTYSDGRNQRYCVFVEAISNERVELYVGLSRADGTPADIPLSGRISCSPSVANAVLSRVAETSYGLVGNTLTETVSPQDSEPVLAAEVNAVLRELAEACFSPTTR